MYLKVVKFVSQNLWCDFVDGYISEIFSSYQGEGGSVLGSQFGKRQIFVRFLGCNLYLDGKKCVYCDTPQALDKENKSCRFQKNSHTFEFIEKANPISTEEVDKEIENLKTSDLHSISFTGGEPLYQVEFLCEISKNLSKFNLYLETNGALIDAAKRLRDSFDFVCVDIKDEISKNCKNFREIVDLELETCKIFSKSKAEVFAKLVVSNETKIENIEYYAKNLSKINVPLAIQIITPYDEINRYPTNNQLFEFTQVASKYLGAKNVSLSYQAHKYFDLL